MKATLRNWKKQLFLLDRRPLLLFASVFESIAALNYIDQSDFLLTCARRTPARAREGGLERERLGGRARCGAAGSPAARRLRACDGPQIRRDAAQNI